MLAGATMVGTMVSVAVAVRPGRSGWRDLSAEERVPKGDVVASRCSPASKAINEGEVIVVSHLHDADSSRSIRCWSWATDRRCRAT